MLIRVLKESRHIWDVFLIKLYDLHAKLFIFFSLFLFRFVSFSTFRCDLS